jgi:hypothetical protein
MTVEAIYKILGIPITTRKLLPLDGEMFMRIEREKTGAGHKDLFSVTTFRVLSEDEIAVFSFHPTAGDPDTLDRGKPTILTCDEINKANLKTSGAFFTGNIHWKQSA